MDLRQGYGLTQRDFLSARLKPPLCVRELVKIDKHDTQLGMVVETLDCRTENEK